MPRRRFQLGIRTLLVAMTLASVVGAYVGYHANWIRQRRDFLQGMAFASCDIDPRTDRYFESTFYWDGRTSPPGLLWAFGVDGVTLLFVREGELDEAHQLFPEATITAL